ncbi:glycosyltransferase [Mesobacillus subterraneus]|uniref:glycosyltransferase n=1 Tax=Mesobacillus subterraneus TaxID=285983 RepID=UPI00203A8BCB|nr:glycosyltransferase [Mesobacillus subterraneus]MCM3665243.1 glycosyltransferase [Mesobacillus subterraneus]MCM3684256.1 glycosyltransferase [Mesobacillus subterraneus]
MSTISIIVPIFNVEIYLHQCIDSILAQTYTNFELILVNDGSSDKSGEICNYYGMKDKRVRVFHKENGGVSSARNMGIRNAVGDYLAFVDPDDAIEPNMYKEFMKAAYKYDPDIVICPIKSINVSDNSISLSRIWPVINSPIHQPTIINDILPSILKGSTFSLVSSVNKLYKKSVFQEYNILFDENKNHSEDFKLNIILLTVVKKMVFIDKPLYNYYIHQRESLTKIFRADLYQYVLGNKKLLLDLCNNYNYNQYIKIVRNHYMEVTLMHMQDVVRQSLPKKSKDKILSKILNDKEFKEDIIAYKCPSSFYKVLKIVCIINNKNLFMNIVNAKYKLQSYIDRLA